MNFIDESVLEIKAGDGGSGCISFRREKYIPKGGPDGGNGGKGGSIIFRTDPSLNTLLDFQNKKIIHAKNGLSGQGRNKSGTSAKDLIINVPVGTMIFDYHSNTLIYDCASPNVEYLLIEGGKGGMGNSNFKTSTNQAPRKSTTGEKGSALKIRLELRSFADIGLVGLPNAGKSTFLDAVSSAKPKIGDYPFTTIKPNLGTIKYFDKSFVFADIPGLIEGASQGTGLGIKFLKHISRTKALLIFLDPHNSEYDFENQLKILINEMRHFDSKLLQKDIWIVLNKIDTVDNLDENLSIIDKYIPSELKIHQIRGISSISKQGVKELFDELFKKLT